MAIIRVADTEIFRIAITEGDQTWVSYYTDWFDTVIELYLVQTQQHLKIIKPFFLQLLTDYFLIPGNPSNVESLQFLKSVPEEEAANHLVQKDEAERVVRLCMERKTSSES